MAGAPVGAPAAPVADTDNPQAQADFQKAIADAKLADANQRQLWEYPKASTSLWLKEGKNVAGMFNT